MSEQDNEQVVKGWRPGDTRKPIGWMTYRGDKTEVAFDRIYGPNYMGELMYPVLAIFDPETDKTRIGFSLIPHPEMQGAAQ